MEQQNSVDGAASAGDKSQTGGAGGGQAQQTKQTELAFKLYDKDKDGYITKTEMEKGGPI